MKQLTSTSFTVLGLLSVQPYSAYGLARQMKRSLHYIWPRAERAIYDEPKNLVAHGLATAEPEIARGRRRTVYTITAAGRRALREWLGAPCDPPMFESEALVRAMFAEQGSKEDLLAAVRSLREHASAMHDEAVAVSRSYVEGPNPFPQRMHINALVGRFVLDYIGMLERWSAWAESEVQQWPSTADPSVFPAALEVYRDFLADRSAGPARPGDSGEHVR
ncbi:PadR family transcriptional regulator [Kitasatospora sp. NPDC085879]|uniref:PadR family transcriptional regulator n=1 Tax=Kitasatospora sp. NPDC085879 TaxID=3154769 RepID=UPI00343A3E15